MSKHTRISPEEAADRLAIRELFDAYAHCADRRDAEGTKGRDPRSSPTRRSRTVNSEADFDAVVEHQALKRRLTPEDTASAVAYLASDAGAAMTGQILFADGGLILR